MGFGGWEDGLLSIFSKFVEFTACVSICPERKCFSVLIEFHVLHTCPGHTLQCFRIPRSDEFTVTVETWFSEVWLFPDYLGLNSGSAVLPAVWPWAGDLTSLILRALCCKA